MNYGMDFQGGGSNDGGGYTNNNSYSPGNSGGNSQTPSKPRRNYDEQTLIPCTIRMVLQAKENTSEGDGSMSLSDGRKVASIKLIGAVRSVQDFSTNVIFEVEDGTGFIEVKQWSDDDNDCTAMQELRQQTLKEHIYVKVIGQLKMYEGKKILVANSVRPLSSGNELTHHFLEVIHSQEKFQRADSIVSAPAVSGGVGFGGGAAPVAEASTGGGNSLKDQVMAQIRSLDDGTDTGVNINDCFKKMSNLPEAEIRKAVESLSEEGHLYSTISEDHFKFSVA